MTQQIGKSSEAVARIVIVQLKPGTNRSLFTSPGEPGSAALASVFVGHKARPLFETDGDGNTLSASRSAEPVPEHLQRYFQLEAASEAEAIALTERLGVFDDVEMAYVEPISLLPFFSFDKNLGGGRAPVGPTESFEHFQTYLEDDEQGMGVRFAWTKAGNRPGVAVRAADIEKGWIFNHEDFDAASIRGPAIMSTDREEMHHGTACIGLAIGRADDHGISGIAPHLDELHCFSVAHERITVASAIREASRVLRQGDVLLIELDAVATEVDRRVPVEFWRATYDVVRETVEKGIVVVAAAGNGAFNLADTRLGGAFTTRPDSGAILVGAGGAPGSTAADRAQLAFSNFGNRVNVQAYGAMVCTTGLGDLQGGEDRRYYTRMFNGTSSAAALVWASCVLLQSIAKKNGMLLTPATMRDVLVRTGLPQHCVENPCAKPIGPRPHLRRAMEHLGIA